MHVCLKGLWAISLTAILFFGYMSVLLATQPQFLPFRPKNIHETINTCIIVGTIYMGIFVGISVIWCRGNMKTGEEGYSDMLEEKATSGDSLKMGQS